MRVRYARAVKDRVASVVSEAPSAQRWRVEACSCSSGRGTSSRGKLMCGASGTHGEESGGGGRTILSMWNTDDEQAAERGRARGARGERGSEVKCRVGVGSSVG